MPTQSRYMPGYQTSYRKPVKYQRGEGPTFPTGETYRNTPSQLSSASSNNPSAATLGRLPVRPDFAHLTILAPHPVANPSTTVPSRAPQSLQSSFETLESTLAPSADSTSAPVNILPTKTVQESSADSVSGSLTVQIDYYPLMSHAALRAQRSRGFDDSNDVNVSVSPSPPPSSLSTPVIQLPPPIVPRHTVPCLTLDSRWPNTTCQDIRAMRMIELPPMPSYQAPVINNRPTSIVTKAQRHVTYGVRGAATRVIHMQPRDRPAYMQDWELPDPEPDSSTIPKSHSESLPHRKRRVLVKATAVPRRPQDDWNDMDLPPRRTIRDSAN